MAERPGRPLSLDDFKPCQANWYFVKNMYIHEYQYDILQPNTQTHHDKHQMQTYMANCRCTFYVGLQCHCWSHRSNENMHGSGNPMGYDGRSRNASVRHSTPASSTCWRPSTSSAVREGRAADSWCCRSCARRFTWARRLACCWRWSSTGSGPVLCGHHIMHT